MDRIPSLAIAATLALAGAASICTAQAAEPQAWTGAAQAWNWPSVPGCKLLVTSVLQTEKGQPYRVQVKNAGTVRLKYSFEVRAVRSGIIEYRSRMSVPSANPGEVTTQLTDTGYRNAGLPGVAQPFVTLMSCAVVSG